MRSIEKMVTMKNRRFFEWLSKKSYNSSIQARFQLKLRTLFFYLKLISGGHSKIKDFLVSFSFCGFAFVFLFLVYGYLSSQGSALHPQWRRP
jgi:hypothetical protein